LVLDLSPNASHNEILHAYTRAKMTYGSGSLASYSLLEEEDRATMLVEIEKAFEILGNPSKRREYDLKMGFESGKVHHESGPVEPQIRSRSNEPAPQAAPPVLPAEGLAAPKPSPKTNVTPIRARPEAVRPDYEPNPEFEKKIAECESLDGAFLKAVRIYRSLSPEQLAALCKLSQSHILSVEDEIAANFPQAVYLRGHVLLICRALELPDPDKLAKTYIERMKSQGKLAKSLF
jgi:hypothetical protein